MANLADLPHNVMLRGDVPRQLSLNDYHKNSDAVRRRLELIVMCTCVECIGYQPEPVEVEQDNGKWAVFYKADKLTNDHETKEQAWAEFEANYTPGH